MAASERASGYQCQFISEVSDDLLCGTCRLVARESHITSCCGEHFCKNCITQVLDTSKLCPSCNEAEFTTLLDKRDQKRILALLVCCTMKDRGCEWMGKLEDLQIHLLVDTNDCQYVDIQCPDKCGESIPRYQLTSHLADSCLNRDYFCKYCNFSDTYRVVCYDHWPKCLHYPVQCPNACSVGSVERGDLEDHIKVCLLQEVSCELSHAGCKETFLREDQDRHMEENTQKHLLLMSAMSQRMSQEFEQKLQGQREEKERETKRMQQMLDESKQEREEQITQAREEIKREKDDQIRALEEKREQEMKALRENSDRAMKEKDKQIREMRMEVESLKYQLQVQGIVQGTVQLQHVPNRCTPPVCFTVKNFNTLKVNNQQWTSPDLYTHEDGHMIRFTVHPNGSPNNISVRVDIHPKPGGLDQHTMGGSKSVKATITLQLLNQYRDRDHFDFTWECEWSKQRGPSQVTNCGSISHTDLEWNDHKQTQYLINNCLVFRLTKVALHTAPCTTL